MKTTSLVAALAAISISASAARAQSTFPDVPDDHWAAQAINRLSKAGIIQGYPAKPKAAREAAASARNPAPRVAKSPAKSTAKSPAKAATRNVAKAAKVARTQSARRD